MDRYLHIISAGVIALVLLGICSCRKGGTRPLEVNVRSINMEKEGGEVRIETKDPVDQVVIWSSDKTSMEWFVDFGAHAYEQYGREMYSEGFVTPETLVIEANDWLSIIVPPYSPKGGVSGFSIKVKANDSAESRDRMLCLNGEIERQAWIPFKQSGR